MIEPKQIIRRKRKSLALTINENGELIVYAPKTMPLFEIFDFVQKKQKWIQSRSDVTKQILNKYKDIVNYNEIFYLGKRYEVCETLGIDETFITEQSLLIKPYKSDTKKQLALKQWYMGKVEDVLLPRVNKLSAFMKQKFSSVSIINSRAKWGMCDNKKNLYFNWKLVMLSPELIDYVIIHELAHLIELNHSQKFWEIVKAVLPNYKHLKEVINKCGFLIRMF